MRFPLPLHWTLRTALASAPSLFFPLYRRFGEHPALLASCDSEIVIDGFPRSGNSFALFALEAAAGRRLAAAHHLHAPAQLMRAARLGKPGCLVIREPAEAIPAALRKIPQLRAFDLLLAYRLHHAALWRWRGAFVTAPFELMIEDFGAVIARLNRRFGSEIPPLSRERQAALTPGYLAEEHRHSAALTAFGRYGVRDPARDPERELAAHPRLLEACQAIYRRYRALA
jgi:hypothetical protein